MDSATYSSMLSTIASMSKVISCISIILLIMEIAGLWKIFVKAGEKGWKSIIPFYNCHMLYKICWKPIFYWTPLILNACIFIYKLIAQSNGNSVSPVVTFLNAIIVIGVFVVTVMQNMKLSKDFGHGVGFGIGLLFLPSIFLLILGFGQSEYHKENVGESV